MTSDAEAILSAALELPEADRLRIANRLYESVPEEGDEIGLSVDDPEFIAEMNRRSSDLSDTVTWGEIMREVGRGP